MSCLEDLGEVSVGTVVIALQQRGLFSCFMSGVHPRTPGKRVLGRARTLSTLPPREDVAAGDIVLADGTLRAHRQAIGSIGPDEVLVIAARGVTTAAVVGDLFAQRVKTLGGAGVVTDGAVRDVLGLAEVDLPVFAAGVASPTFPTAHIGYQVDRPVGCAETLVVPGDVILGDAEGVAVIPAAVADEIAAAAKELELRDRYLRDLLVAGESLDDVYPPNPDVLGRYQAFRDTAQ